MEKSYGGRRISILLILDKIIVPPSSELTLRLRYNPIPMPFARASISHQQLGLTARADSLHICRSPEQFYNGYSVFVLVPRFGDHYQLDRFNLALLNSIVLVTDSNQGVVASFQPFFGSRLSGEKRLFAADTHPKPIPCNRREAMKGHLPGSSPRATPIEDMGVNHRRLGTFVAQQLFNSSDVISIFKQMRGKTMP